MQLRAASRASRRANAVPGKRPRRTTPPRCATPRSRASTTMPSAWRAGSTATPAAAGPRPTRRADRRALALDAMYQRAGQVAERAQQPEPARDEPHAGAAQRRGRSGEPPGASRCSSRLPPSAALATAWRVQAWLCEIARDREASIRYSTQALELAERLGERETAVLAINSLGAAMIHIDYDAGRAHLLRAVDMGMAEGRHFVVGNALNNLAFAICECVPAGRRPDRCLARALELCEHEAIRAQSQLLPGLAGPLRRSPGSLGRRRCARAGAGPVGDMGHAAASSPCSRSAACRRGAATRAPRPRALTRRWRRHRRALAGAGGARRGGLAARRHRAPWSTRHGMRWRWSSSGASPGIGGELAYWLHRAGAGEGIPARCAAPYALQIEGALGRGRRSLGRRSAAPTSKPARWPKATATRRCRPGGVRRPGREAGGRCTARATAQGGAADAAARRATATPKRIPFQLTAREVEVLSLLCARPEERGDRRAPGALGAHRGSPSRGRSTPSSA